MRRFSARVRGFGTPIHVSDRPILSVRYGLHPAYGQPGGRACLKIDADWRTLSGFAINTPWGALWVYFRNWRYDRTTYFTKPYKMRRSS